MKPENKLEGASYFKPWKFIIDIILGKNKVLNIVIGVSTLKFILAIGRKPRGNHKPLAKLKTIPSNLREGSLFQLSH